MSGFSTPLSELVDVGVAVERGAALIVHDGDHTRRVLRVYPILVVVRRCVWFCGVGAAGLQY